MRLDALHYGKVLAQLLNRRSGFCHCLRRFCAVGDPYIELRCGCVACDDGNCHVLEFRNSRLALMLLEEIPIPQIIFAVTDVCIVADIILHRENLTAFSHAVFEACKRGGDVFVELRAHFCAIFL